MLHIDSMSNLTLSLDDICALDSEQVSDTGAFRKFATGIHLTEDFLLNERWSHSQPPAGPVGAYGFVMHEMLPEVYDAAHLESIGGTFGLRLTGVGDYTVAAVNMRVIVLSGLPQDLGTGEDVVDLEIAPDIFMAYARSLLLEISEGILDDDDEFEDRPLSNAELQLYGMPAGSGSMVAERGDASYTNINALSGDGVIGTAHYYGDVDIYGIYLTENTSVELQVNPLSGGAVPTITQTRDLTSSGSYFVTVDDGSAYSNSYRFGGVNSSQLHYFAVDTTGMTPRGAIYPEYPRL